MFCCAVLNAVDENGWFWEQARAASSPLHSRMGGKKPLVVFELWYHPDDQTETTTSLGMSPSQHTAEDDQGRLKTFALGKRHQSQDLGYASAIQGNPRVAESGCEQHAWHLPGDQLQSQELKPSFLHTAQVPADTCRCVGVNSSWERETSGLQMGEEPWLSIDSQILTLMEKQHPIWLSNPGQFPGKKGKETEKKGELSFFKMFALGNPCTSGSRD